MLRAFLFVLAIACAIDAAPAQTLEGRLKQISETKVMNSHTGLMQIHFHS